MNREVIMSTLWGLLTGPPAIFLFDADTTTGDAVLANVSDSSGLLLGMPINGPGVPEHATLVSLAPVTLSVPALTDNTAATMLQGFQTASRRLAQAGEEADMPAMYLVDLAEQHFPGQSNEPGQSLLSCEVRIYSDAGEDPDAVPSSALNYLLDAVERAIGTAPNAPLGPLQNLGLKGVIYARIEGEVIKDPGDNGRMATAIVPIKIRVGDGIDNYPM